MMISEHVSDKPHNKSKLERELKAASERYDKALTEKDKTGFNDLLAEDFTSTGIEGKLRNKSDEMEHMMTPNLVILNSKADDKNFRLYRNTGVETGMFKVNGTYKGKPFAEVGRYTTTWIYRDGKWKIVADHTSPMPDSN